MSQAMNSLHDLHVWQARGRSGTPSKPEYVKATLLKAVWDMLRRHRTATLHHRGRSLWWCFLEPRFGHTTTFVGENRVVLFGGATGDTGLVMETLFSNFTRSLHHHSRCLHVECLDHSTEKKKLLERRGFDQHVVEGHGWRPSDGCKGYSMVTSIVYHSLYVGFSIALYIYSSVILSYL